MKRLIAATAMALMTMTGGAVADGHARHDDRTVPDPGVVTDADPLPGTPVEEILIICLAFEIPGRAIGEMMQRGPLHRMHAGIDPDVRCDIGELADRRIGDLGVLGAVGIVAHA